MKRLEYRGWVLEVDPEATRRGHSAAGAMGPITCSCCDCRNFLAAREAGLVYPSEVLTFLDLIGITPPAETEIAALGRDKDAKRVVSGWLHAVGTVRDGPETLIRLSESSTRLQLVNIGEAFEFGIVEGKALAPVPLRDQPLLQIEFVVKLPWLLGEPEPEES